MTPSNNPAYSLIGTGEFSFAEGATTVAQAQALGFKDFGNIKVFTIDPGGDKKEHSGAYRGVVGRDRVRVSGLKMGYKLTADEYDSFKLALIYAGKNLTDVTTQAAIAAVAGTAITFSGGSPSLPDRWYDLRNGAGAHVRAVTGVTIATKTEGTDFEVDYQLGRIRFLTAQTAALTPTITAAAINAGDPGSFSKIVPLSQPTRTGIGRLYVFDDDARQNIVWGHEDFGCDISLDSSTDVKGDDWNDFGVMVAVSAARPGIVLGRNS